MHASNVFVLAAIACIVVVPLAGEYLDLRRSRLSRFAALGTTALVFPALALGIALSVPLSAHPMLQWGTTIVATLLVYSCATRAILASASSVAIAPSRSTRG